MTIMLQDEMRFRRLAGAKRRAAPSQPKAPPPWHSVPTAIARRFHQICAAKTTEVVSQSDITPLQYGVLIHLSAKTGTPEIEQNVLAERLNVDRNTASVLVEQLVKKGLVERTLNGADRRVRLLSLTAKGQKLFAQLSPAHALANQRILAPLAAHESKILIDLLIRVIEANLNSEMQGSRRRKTRPSQS
jgi:DNA-binding MarR family transcriptional regulator